MEIIVIYTQENKRVIEERLKETEKAHPQVFNVFLRLFDEGKFTNGRGRAVDFKNITVIITLNGKVKESVMEIMKKSFKPEIFNRLDDVIVFSPLEEKELKEIVKLQLRELKHLLDVFVLLD
ncbi:hypothetical protein ENUP19_0055G0060 [Entamoeba nuttalli]|uniref:ATPase AAA-type core domain-containing protein n=1 Tax=Entamoeba nuttalli TaxID=412467 RepID=A0ABQ0DCL4_9EUKA